MTRASRVRPVLAPVAGLVLVGILVSSGVAYAQPDDPTSKMVEVSGEGVKLYQAGRYEEAIERFDAAYKLVQDANLLFNIGRCYQKLGRVQEAITHYERFLASEDILAGDRERAQRRIDSLRALLKAPPPPPDEPPPPNKPKTVKRSRAVEWTLIGSGAVILVGGGVCGALAMTKQSAFEDENAIDKKEDLRDDMRTLALVSDISIGIGAAALVTGLVLYAVRDDEVPAGEGNVDVTARIAPLVLPGGGGAVVGGRF